MNTTDTDRDKVVIPDTDGARSLAERFGKFLALGASKSSGVGAVDALARDVEAYRMEQPNSARSALPCLSNSVGIMDAGQKPEPELGVECGQTVADACSGSIALDAATEPHARNMRNEEGDQLCMAY